MDGAHGEAFVTLCLGAVSEANGSAPLGTAFPKAGSRSQLADYGEEALKSVYQYRRWYEKQLIDINQLRKKLRQVAREVQDMGIIQNFNEAAADALVEVMGKVLLKG